MELDKRIQSCQYVHRKDVRSNQSSDKVFNLRDKLMQFWAEESSGMITKYDRNKFIGYFLLMMQEYVVMNFNFNKYTNDLMISKNEQSSGYMRLIIIEKWPEGFIFGLYLFATSSTFILFFYVFVKLIYYLCCNRSIRNQPLISFYLKLYNYFVFQATIYCHIYYFSYSPPLSVASFVISSIIMVITAHLDYDIRFHSKDFLARRESRQDLLIGLIQAIATYKVCLGEENFSLTWFVAIYQLIIILWNYNRHPYWNAETQRFRFGLCVCNFMLSLSLIIFLSTKYQQIDYILLLLINAPVSFYAGNSIMALRQKLLIEKCFLTSSMIAKSTSMTSIAHSSKLNSNQTKNRRELDIFLRLLYSQVDGTLKQQPSFDVSIILEQIISDHLLTCNKQKECFCYLSASCSCKKQNESKGRESSSSRRNYEQTRDIISKEDYMSDHSTKQYLDDYILRRFEAELKNPKVQFTQFHFSYFSFLTNPLCNEFVSLRETIKLKESVYKKSGTFIKQKINLLYEIAEEEFELHVKKIQLQSHVKIIDVLDFDKLLTEAYQKYSELLRMKLGFLNLIKNDELNIQQIQNYAKTLSSKRDALKLILLFLQRKKSFSPFLAAICTGFVECLTIENPFFKQRGGFRENTRSGIKFDLFQKKIKNGIQLHSETTVTVFVSLLSQVGYIRKVSRNFLKVTDFCKNTEELIGKNISTIMSEEVAAVHDQIVLHNLSKNYVNYSVRSFPVLIAKNSQGWSYPIIQKTQITLIGINELGSCASIQPIRDGNYYIQTSDTSHELQVQIMSKHIFQVLFSTKQRLKNQKQIDQTNIRKIKLSRLAPLLSSIIQNEQQAGADTLYETIIIQPTSFEHALQHRNILSRDFLKSLLHTNLFSIKFALFPIYNDLIRIVQIKIVSIQPLQKPALKNEALHKYMLQLSKYHDITQMMPTFDYVFNQLNNEEYSKNIGKKLILPSNINQSIQFTKEPTNLQIQSMNFSQYHEEKNLTAKYHSNSSTNFEQVSSHNIKTTHVLQLQKQSPKRTLSSTSLRINKIVESQNYLGLQGEQQQSIISRLVTTGSPTLLSFSDNNTSNNEPAIEQNQKDQIISNSSLEPEQSHRTKSQQGISSIVVFPSSPAIDNEIQDTNRITSLSLPTHRNQQGLFDGQIILTPHATEDEGILMNKNQQGFAYRNHSKRWNWGITEHDGEDENEWDQQSIEVEEDNKKIKSGKLNKQVNLGKKGKNIFENKQINREAEDIRSMNSSVTNKQSVKKQRILKVIRSNRLSLGLQIVQMIGVLSIVLIAIGNCVSFSVLNSDLNIQQVNFENFYWCFQVKRHIGLVLGVHKVFLSTMLNQFSFDSVAAYKKYLFLVVYTEKQVQMGFKNRTIELMNLNFDKVFILQQVWDYPIQIQIPNSLDSSKSQSYSSTLAGKIIYWNYFAYSLFFQEDSQMVNTNTAFVNHFDMLDGLTVISDRNVVNVHENIQASKNLIIYMLIGIVMVSSILSLLILPIYSFNQKKREDIMKLFATIPAARIEFMLNSVEEHQIQMENFERIRLKQAVSSEATERMRGMQVDAKAGNQVKRKTISATTSLIRFQFKFIPFLLVSLIFTLVNPISTYSIYSTEFTNFQAAISLLNSMEELFENVSQLMSIKYELTFAKLTHMDDQVIKSYIDLVNLKRGQSQKFLTNLIYQEQIYEENESTFDSESIQNYVIPIFKGNICETLEKQNRDVREIIIQPARCKVIFEGLFTKGLLVVSKSVISYLDTFYDTAQSNDIEYFKSAILQMQKHMSMSDELEMFSYYLFLTKIIQYFFIDLFSDYYAYIETLSTIFLCLQLVLLAAVLIFGWRKFYVFICNELFATKQLIDIIDIDTLLNNQYVTSYFFKNNYLKN